MVRSGHELPVSTELASTPTMRMKLTRRPQRNGNMYKLYLQLKGLYTRLGISPLVDAFLQSPSQKVWILRPCHRGSHRWLVYAGQRGAIPDCIMWPAHNSTHYYSQVIVRYVAVHCQVETKPLSIVQTPVLVVNRDFDIRYASCKLPEK